MTVKPPTIYPDVETIRQIQEIMLTCTLLAPESRMADLIHRALNTPPEPARERIQPITDLHPHEVKAWFERNWPPDHVSPMEKELIDWQRNTENMTPAVAELKEVESVLGIKLVAAIKS